MSFDPNGIGVANGNFCGLPVRKEEAELILIPVPWDATASYGRGAANGPAAILEASLQLDLFHHRYPQVHNTRVFMEEIDADIKRQSELFGERTAVYMDFLSNGGHSDESEASRHLLEEINDYQEKLRKQVYQNTKQYLDQGKKVAVIGGEHSTSLGAIQAYADHYSDFGILQIDAHADLRDSYEGFEQSHASIMHNALKSSGVKQLVQVGVRDLSEQENEIIHTDERLTTFFDWILKEAQFNNESWADQCVAIIQSLPQNVYISFDIDGLEPSLCSDTGTPVPGGLRFEEAAYLLQQLAMSDKNIVGFDLCEVTPGENKINEIVGARILMELVLCTLNSK